MPEDQKKEISRSKLHLKLAVVMQKKYFRDDSKEELWERIKKAFTWKELVELGLEALEDDYKILWPVIKMVGTLEGTVEGVEEGAEEGAEDEPQKTEKTKKEAREDRSQIEDDIFAFPGDLD